MSVMLFCSAEMPVHTQFVIVKLWRAEVDDVTLENLAEQRDVTVRPSGGVVKLFESDARPLELVEVVSRGDFRQVDSYGRRAVICLARSVGRTSP